MVKNKESFLSSVDVEKEENLSLNILKSFKCDTIITDDDRPKSNLIDLMKWSQNKFSKSLKDTLDLNKFIHNKIIIDGQFIKFCEESNVNIKCLYKDSVVSWKTPNNYEKFFVQGVFLIKSKDFEFIHCALFHKGNQNEDEVSFFVIVSDKNYEKYISFRNSFEEWELGRDRANLFIRVVDGDDIPYTKDHSWDELFYPPQLKKDIKNLVESFLASKDFYKQNNIPYKRGILLYGLPGCGKTSFIRTLISNYNFKPVTIVAGATDDMIKEAFSYAESQAPSLLYFEDLDSLLNRIDVSAFLNLMDGVSAKNGMLVVATANDISKLKGNITNRPSRFDRKFEIPLPNESMCVSYVTKWFGKTITVAKAKKLAKFSYTNKFSYAHIKELYISSMFEAIAHNRKVPTETDIDKALKCLIQERDLSSGQINTAKYFEQGK